MTSIKFECGVFAIRTVLSLRVKKELRKSGKVCVCVCVNSSECNADRIERVNRHAGLETEGFLYLKGVISSSLTHLKIVSTHIKRRNRIVYMILGSKMHMYSKKEKEREEEGREREGSRGEGRGE